MAFPTTLTNAQDYVTVIMAAHLNSLEAKVGVDSSAVATSLDYLVKNTSSIDPGHKHSKLWASDGSPEAVTVGATGVVTVDVGIVFPTPFTLGAISVTTTGTQLNYLAAATGTTGTASTNVVFSASPTFTGIVTIPTPFTLGAISVTATGTQLNYLASATGTTGTATTNVVFSTSPTLTDPVIANISPAANFTLTQNAVIPVTSVSAGALVNTVYLLAGNVGMGVTAFGTNAVRVLGIASGTSPTTSPANMAQLWVADRNGVNGTASLHYRNEDDTTNQSIALLYGEMYNYENAVATPIDLLADYHAIITITEGSVKGFTFKVGSTGPIASFATHSGGLATLITDVGHGLLNGEVITISNSTNYTGSHVITWIDADTFTIPVAYVAEAGGPNWVRGSSLQANPGSAGIYRVVWGTTIFPAGASVIIRIQVSKNTTVLNNMCGSTRLVVATDYRNIAGGGFISIADGDYIWLSVRNETDDTDVTLRHSNVNINKIG